MPGTCLDRNRLIGIYFYPEFAVLQQRECASPALIAAFGITARRTVS